MTWWLWMLLGVIITVVTFFIYVGVVCGIVAKGLEE